MGRQMGRQMRQRRRRNPGSLDLNVASVDRVAPVLHAAVDVYYEAGSELTAAWQQKSAGRPWERIARILDSAATLIERVVREEGLD